LRTARCAPLSGPTCRRPTLEPAAAAHRAPALLLSPTLPSAPQFLTPGRVPLPHRTHAPRGAAAADDDHPRPGRHRPRCKHPARSRIPHAPSRPHSARAQDISFIPIHARRRRPASPPVRSGRAATSGARSDGAPLARCVLRRPIRARFFSFFLCSVRTRRPRVSRRVAVDSGTGCAVRAGLEVRGRDLAGRPIGRGKGGIFLEIPL
jgi:hypothetical protein